MGMIDEHIIYYEEEKVRIKNEYMSLPIDIWYPEDHWKYHLIKSIYYSVTYGVSKALKDIKDEDIIVNKELPLEINQYIREAFYKYIEEEIEEKKNIKRDRNTKKNYYNFMQKNAHYSLFSHILDDIEREESNGYYTVSLSYKIITLLIKKVRVYSLDHKFMEGIDINNDKEILRAFVKHKLKDSLKTVRKTLLK